MIIYAVVIMRKSSKLCVMVWYLPTNLFSTEIMISEVLFLLERVANKILISKTIFLVVGHKKKIAKVVVRWLCRTKAHGEMDEDRN